LSQQFLQGSQRRAAIVSKETEVTDFDEAFGENMLEETLDELLNG
jgi:hypothetical protein